MAGRNALGVGTTEERLQRLEMLANFREYIAPVSVVGGRDSGATPPLHPLLSALGHSDTTTQVVSRGSLIYGNSTPAWDELVAPAATGVLAHDATDAAWVTTTTNGAVLRRNNVGVIGFGGVDLDTSGTVIGTLAVANGGTNLSSGTSGGVLAYTASGTLASSAALADNVLVVGGGAGAVPNTLTAGLGTTSQVLHGNASGEPTWGQVAIATEVSGLGTGVATFLGTPSSANLLAAVTDETGSSSGTPLLVFNQSPTIVTPTIASFANATHNHTNAAGGGQLAHTSSVLTGLATGDAGHTTLALLAGRTGTTNNLTLSTDADGTLTGSGTSGFDLRLVSDGHSTGGSTVSVGYLHAIQPIRLIPDGYTIDCDTSGFGMSAATNRNLGLIVVGDGTLTLSGTNPSFRILTANGTVSLTESNGDSVGMCTLFNHGLTYTNADGLNFGPTQTLVDVPTFSATTTAGARTHSQHAAVFCQPTLSRAAGANTYTLTALHGLRIFPAVNTGTVITTLYGVSMGPPSGIAAGVGTRIGLQMEYGGTSGGTARITTDRWLSFDAAAGTHGAVAAASGGAVTPTFAVNQPITTAAVAGWLRINANGTQGFIPYWT